MMYSKFWKIIPVIELKKSKLPQNRLWTFGPYFLMIINKYSYKNNYTSMMEMNEETLTGN